MNTATDSTIAVPSESKRIILASAYRHERHSTGRQERALKTLRKMGRFDEDQMLDNRLMRCASSEGESVDE